MGISNTSAISLYDSPSMSLRTTIRRWSAESVASAFSIRARCSEPAAAASGLASSGWSTSTRSQSSSGIRSVPNARPRAERARSRSAATFITIRNSHV